MHPVRANGIRTGDPRKFNKGRSSKFREGSRVRQTPEEGRRTYRPKHYGNDKDEDYSPKTLNDKNHQASSQKFRQLYEIIVVQEKNTVVKAGNNEDADISRLKTLDFELRISSPLLVAIPTVK